MRADKRLSVLLSAESPVPTTMLGVQYNELNKMNEFSWLK